MKYEIGEYGLTREKVPVSFLKNTGNIHYLWYVDGSATGTIYDTYEQAMEEVKKKMRADEETGRMKDELADDHIIIYFTAGWEDHSCQLWMHISGNYDEETLKVIREYDDRIFIEEV